MLQTRERSGLHAAVFTSDNGSATAGVRFYLRVCSTFEIEYTAITYDFKVW